MIDAVHEELVRSGILAPVALGGADERRWLDFDLASLAENRLGDTTDPRAVDEARRAAWTERATIERPWSLGARSKYERCYWLVQDAERVGTIALSNGALGERRVHLASFYLLPEHRGRGAGRRVLARVQEALARHRLGLRLDTSWCWQRAVRFYLGAGMWVYMWKRDLTFFSDARTPAPRIEVSESTATLSVPLGEGSVVLARAHRRGDALELEEPPRELADDKRIGEACYHASSTLSVALATHGWPLVRSQAEWDEGYFADGGPPEALAYKIGVWEAWDRDQGWLVSTPRIAGLVYPTWDELEARWTAQRAELEASLVRAPADETDESDEDDTPA